MARVLPYPIQLDFVASSEFEFPGESTVQSRQPSRRIRHEAKKRFSVGEAQEKRMSPFVFSEKRPYKKTKQEEKFYFSDGGAEQMEMGSKRGLCR